MNVNRGAPILVASCLARALVTLSPRVIQTDQLNRSELQSGSEQRTDRLLVYFLGAAHQTGWTGLVAALIHFFGVVDPAHLLSRGMSGVYEDAAAGRS